MKVLFIGGTGNISTSCSKYAIEKGIDLFLLNRGKTSTKIDNATFIQADTYNFGEMKEKLKEFTFDVVVNWIAYTAADVERDFKLFKTKTKQYIFISSASVYQKPPNNPVITESTPLKNPFMEYSRNKIACEEFLLSKYRENNFPATIVRPSHTYATIMPVAVGGWGTCYTIMDRMLRRKEVVIHGDGTSLWVVTHSDDFAKGLIGLFGKSQALGQSYHITSDELLTWNQIYKIIGNALGVKPNIVHIPSDFIYEFDNDYGSSLLGDKSHSVIFDNSKIKELVPNFRSEIPFSEGVKKVLEWFDENPDRKVVDPKINDFLDSLLEKYKK